MNEPELQLQDRIALVTGASRGIGAATARLLARRGAHVILSSRSQEALQEVAAAIEDTGGRATAMACHVGDPQGLEALVAQIEAQFDRLDILVNNAAANPVFGSILDTGLEAVDKVLSVNVRGYFHLSILAARIMRARGGGCIINVSSINGERPGPGLGIYSVSKAAVIAMTRAFAKECAAYGIRVNAVLPGLTRTRFAAALIDDERQLRQILPAIPMGRVAEPEEIAPAIAFLASDAAAYITGVTLPVDGGFLT